MKHEYPTELANAVDHARRLAKILLRLEKERPDSLWSRGRASEVRAVLDLTLSDWREGRTDLETLVDSLLSYLDEVHQGSARRLGCSPVLECCRPVGEMAECDQAYSPEFSAAQSDDDWLATVSARWGDPPEVVKRVHDHMDCVRAHAHALFRRIGKACPLEDLQAFGREGLLDAARSFNDRRGVPFEAWASLRIRSAMIDGVRHWGVSRGVIRKLKAIDARNQMDGRVQTISLRSIDAPATERIIAAIDEPEDTLAATGASPEEALANAEVSALIRKKIGELPGDERQVVEEYYFGDRTLEEAASFIGVQRSWASRLHGRALLTLRRGVRKLH